MKEQNIDKLRKMLMDHHDNRWHNIMERKNIETRIDET